MIGVLLHLEKKERSCLAQKKCERILDCSVDTLIRAIQDINLMCMSYRVMSLIIFFIKLHFDI